MTEIQENLKAAVKFHHDSIRSEGFKALEAGRGWREATLVASLFCMSHAEQQRFLVPQDKRLFRSWFATAEYIIDGIRVVRLIDGGVAMAGSDESVIEAALPMISEDLEIAQFEFLLRGCMSSEQFHDFNQHLTGATTRDVAALSLVLVGGAPIADACQGMPPEHVKKLFGAVCDLVRPHIEAVAA